LRHRARADVEHDAIRSASHWDLIAKECPIILEAQGSECTFDDLDQEDMVIVGDVDHVIRKVERYQRAGLDHVHRPHAGGRIPHEVVLRSIELFGREVIPRFR
jgi:alkanesulfonate monooxygenase SsuD/methylene tetrahydromethanopterin reductase-like flavin-dependent oxidoreductase (luciferase family)